MEGKYESVLLFTVEYIISFVLRINISAYNYHVYSIWLCEEVFSSYLQKPFADFNHRWWALFNNQHIPSWHSRYISIYSSTSWTISLYSDKDFSCISISLACINGM